MEGASDLVFTDMGAETHMIFIFKRDLNNFALFECIKDEEGRKLLTQLYESYLKVGQSHGVKMLFLTPFYHSGLSLAAPSPASSCGQ